MEQSASGKFCYLCSKNAIDFSVLSDVEIIKIIENPSRDICAKWDIKLSKQNKKYMELNPTKVG